MVTVRIPQQLRHASDGIPEVRLHAATVKEAVGELSRRYPLLRQAILAETGEVRGFVNIFVNADDIRRQARLETPLRDGDIVHILPSVAGG